MQKYPDQSVLANFFRYSRNSAPISGCFSPTSTEACRISQLISHIITGADIIDADHAFGTEPKLQHRVRSVGFLHPHRGQYFPKCQKFSGESTTPQNRIQRQYLIWPGFFNHIGDPEQIVPDRLGFERRNILKSARQLLPSFLQWQGQIPRMHGKAVRRREDR